MNEKTVLPIGRTDAEELRIGLESFNTEKQEAAIERVADLLWEAVHCSPDMTWLQPNAVPEF